MVTPPASPNSHEDMQGTSNVPASSAKKKVISADDDFVIPRHKVPKNVDLSSTELFYQDRRIKFEKTVKNDIDVTLPPIDVAQFKTKELLKAEIISWDAKFFKNAFVHTYSPIEKRQLRIYHSLLHLQLNSQGLTLELKTGKQVALTNPNLIEIAQLRLDNYKMEYDVGDDLFTLSNILANGIEKTVAKMNVIKNIQKLDPTFDGSY